MSTGKQGAKMRHTSKVTIVSQADERFTIVLQSANGHLKCEVSGKVANPFASNDDRKVEALRKAKLLARELDEAILET